MKCPNCGFDCEGQFCSMCGTPLRQQSPQSTPPQNPYINTLNVNSVNSQPDTAPPAQHQGNFAAVPPQQQSPFSGNVNQPQNTFAGNAGRPQNGFAPVPAQPTAPPLKNKKAGKIVLPCVLGAIILAGIVIMIVSAVANSSGTPTTTYSPAPSNTNVVQYRVGETAETLFGSIALTDVRAGKFSTGSAVASTDEVALDDEYMFEFFIENTSDEDFSVSFNNFNVSVKNKSVNYSLTNIAIDDNPVSITMKPHSTDTFRIYRSDPNYDEDRDLKITYRYTLSDNSSGTVVFIKNSPVFYNSLFDETETDFGTFKVTDIKTPSPKEMAETYLKGYNEKAINPEDYFDYGEEYTLYEFSVDINTSKTDGKSLSLNTILASCDYSLTDGITTSIFAPVAASSGNYNYNISDSSKLLMQFDADKSSSFKFLIPLKNDCDSLHMSFQFGNGNTVKIESTLSELEYYIS